MRVGRPLVAWSLAGAFTAALLFALRGLGAPGTLLAGLVGGAACGLAAFSLASTGPARHPAARFRVVLCWIVAGLVATGLALVLTPVGEMLRTRWLSSIGFAGWIAGGAAGGVIGTWGSSSAPRGARPSRSSIALKSLWGGLLLALGVWVAIVAGYVADQLVGRWVPAPYSMLFGWFLGGGLGGALFGGAGSLTGFAAARRPHGSTRSAEV